MKKSNNLLVGILAFFGSTTLAASCAAPGSSKPISADNGNVVIEKKNTTTTEKLPTNLTTSTNQDYSDSDWTTSISDISISYSTERKVSETHQIIKSNEKINYVAIGDSITAGFDGALPKDYPGELLSNGEITGASYPSFLANILNQKSRIAQFKNYAVSGSTILDWINFLEIQYDSKSKLDSNSLITKYGKNSKVKEELLVNLANANLITFTLGANDFFYLIFDELRKNNVFEIIENLTSDNPSYQKAAEFVNSIYASVVPEVKKRLATFISQLKNLAPNAHINLVSYPTPFLGLKDIFDKAFLDLVGDKLKLSITDTVISVLNDNLMEVASKYGINYVNAYNPNYWNKHYDELSSILIDIHPNTRAYKKMAMDIYLKITNSKLDLSSYGSENYDFDQDFINSDRNTTNYQIEPNANPLDILGWNTSTYLNKENEFEKELDVLRTPRNFSNRIIELASSFKTLALSVFNILITNRYYLNIDPEQKLRELLYREVDGELVIENLIQEIFDSNVIQNIIFNIQSNLRSLNAQNKLNLNTLFDAIKDGALKTEYIFNLINAIAKSKLVNVYKDDFKVVLPELALNTLRIHADKIIDLVVSATPESVSNTLGLSSEEFKALIRSIVFDNQTNDFDSNFIGVLTLVLETFVINSSNFEQVSSIREVLNAFIVDPNWNGTIDLSEYRSEFAVKLAKYAKKIVKKVIEVPSIKNFIIELVTNLLAQNKLLLNEQEKADFRHLFGNFIDNLNDKNFDHGLFDLAQEFIAQFISGFPSIEPDQINDLVTKSIGEAAKAHFGQSENIFKVIKLLSRSITANQTPEQVQTNKDIIKTIVNNFLQSENINLALLIEKVLPDSIKGSIDEYIGYQNFQELITNISRNPEFKTIINYFLDKLINSLDELESAHIDFENPQEIIRFILQKIDINEIEDPIKQLIVSLLNDPKIQELIRLSLIKVFENLELDPNAQIHQKLISDLSTGLISLFKELDFMPTVVDKLFEGLSEATKTDTTEEFVEKLKEIPSKLIDVVAQKVKPDVFGFIKKIIGLEIIQTNSEAWVEVLTKAFERFATSNLIDELFITSIRPFLENNSDYINPGEVELLLKDVILLSDTSSLFKNILSILISNPQWTETLTNKSTPKEIFDTIFALPNFKENVLIPLKPIVLEVLQNKKYSLTLLQLINYFAKQNQIDLDLPNHEAIASELIETALIYAKNTNLITRVVDSLFEAIEQSSNLDEILSNVKAIAQPLISDFSILEFSKFLLEKITSWTESDKDALVAFLMHLFDQIVQHDELTNWLNAIPFDESNFVNVISKENLISLVTKLLTNEHFKEFLKPTLDTLFDFNTAAIKTWESPLELLLAFVRNPEYLAQVKTNVVTLFNDLVLENDTVDFTLVKVLAEFLKTNESIKFAFEGIALEQLEQVLQGAIPTAKFAIKELDLVNALYKGLENFAKSNETNLKQILPFVLESLKEAIKSVNLNETSFKIFKHFLDQTTLDSDSKIVFKKIISNVGTYIFRTIEKEEIKSFINSLPTNLLTEINKYVANENLAILLFEVVKNTSFQNIVESSLNKVLDHWNEFKEANLTNWNDFAQKLLSILDLSSFKDDLKALINGIFDSENSQLILERIIVKLIQDNFQEFYRANVNATNSFAHITATNIKKLIVDLGIWDSTLDYMIQILDEMKSQEDIVTFAQGIPSKLLNKVLESIQTNGEYDLEKIKAKVITLLKSPIFTENKELISKFISHLLSLESTKDKLRNLANQLVDKIELDEKIAKYLDKETILATVNFALDNQNLLKLVESFILALINNDNLLISELEKPLFKPEDAIFNILKATNFVETNKEAFLGFVHQFLESEAFDQTFNKLLTNFLKENNLITSELNDSFIGDLRLTILNTLTYNTSSPLSQKIINKIIEVFKMEDVVNWSTFVEKFKANLTSLFDLNDYSLIKSLLNSRLFKPENEAILKELATNALNTYLTNNKVAELIDGINDATLSSISTKIGLTTSEAKELLKNIYNDNDLGSLLQEISSLVITELVKDRNAYKDANSYNDLVKAIFSQNDVVTTLKPKAIEILNNFLQSDKTKNFVVSTIKNALKSEGFKPYVAGLTETELDSISENLLDAYFVVDNVLGLSSVAYDTLVKELATNGYEIQTLSIIQNLFAALKENLSKDNLEQKVLELIRALSTSKLLNNNKSALLKILENSYEQIKKIIANESLLNKLPNSALETLSQYIEVEKLDILVKSVVGSSEFKNVFFDTLNSIITNISSYQNVRSVGELLQITLQNIKFEEFKNNLVGLIRFILKHEEINNVFKSLLTRTLNTFHVDTTTSDVQKLIEDLAKEGSDFLANLNVFEQIIERVFKEIQDHASSKEELEQTIQNIPNLVKTILETEFSDSFIEIANKIYKLEAISTNKSTLKKVLVALIKGLHIGPNDSGRDYIIEWISPLINQINSPILTIEAKKHLINVFKDILDQDILYELLDSVLESFLNEPNLDFLSNYKNPYLILKHFINNESFVANIKAKLHKLIIQITRNESKQISNLAQFVNSVIFKFLNIEGLDAGILEIANKEKLVQDVLNDWGNWIEQSGAYNSVFDALIQTIQSTNTIDEFVSNIGTNIWNSLDLANNFELVKQFINLSTNVSKNQETWNKIAKSLIVNIFSSEKHIDKIVSLVNLDFLVPYNIANDEFADAIKSILKSQNVQKVAIKLAEHVINHFDDFKSANSYNDLLKILFSNHEFNQELITLVKELLGYVGSDEKASKLLGKFAYYAIKNSEYPEILNNINETNGASLFGSFFSLIAEIDQNVQLIDPMLNKLFEQLENSGINADFASLFQVLGDSFKNYVVGDLNLMETRILILLRTALNSETVRNNNETFKVFIKNIVDFIIKKIDFGQMIWEQIPSESQGFILANFVDNRQNQGVQVFSNIINEFIKVPETASLINNLVGYVLNNHEALANETTLANVLRKYLVIPSNETQFKSDMKEFLLGSLKTNSFKINTEYIIHKFFDFLGVQKNDLINNYVTILANNLYAGIDRLGILDNLLDVLVQIIKQPGQSLDEMVTKIKNNIFASLQLTEYSTFKKFLSDNLVIGSSSLNGNEVSHKEAVKQILKEVISKLLTQDDKLTQIVQDLNLAGLVFNETEESNKELINKTIVRFIKNDKLKKALQLMVDDVLDRPQAYLAKNSWYGALNALLNKPTSSSLDSLKTNLKGWIVEIINSNENTDEFFGGLARIVLKKLIESNWNLSLENDHALFTAVLKGGLRTIVNSSEFNTVFENIYKNLQNTDFEQAANPGEAFLEAIKKGALSIITSDKNPKNISLSKILDKTKLIENLIAAIGNKNYVKLINRLFDASEFSYRSTNNGYSGSFNLEKTTGMYKLIYNALLKPKDPNSESLGFDFDVSIFSVVGKAEVFFKAFFKPIYSELFRRVTNNEYDSSYQTYYKRTDEYKALFRMYTTFLWFIGASVGYDSGKFWNAIGADVQAIINRGATSAFDEAKIQYSKFNEYLPKWYKTMGALNGWFNKGWYNAEFIQGNRSSSTYYSNYWSDQLLAYIYFFNKVKDRHSARTMTEVLLDALRKGYLKSDK
ncbi:SGNH/GDSL hydrolase family protein [Mycoplasmopsis glycophila]|uniref:Uncharacterized protein n=1 Tax=Mycoplasmopsis glycophila TaxID=171285 RepID=A0A449AUP8_9BACT|nr:SGNH/GDSL hydrolase family protein [Mycoplasmopsis glycophila]VEU70237.1 Uncharacterised protein [Mycoplasmopsis glycophila]